MAITFNPESGFSADSTSVIRQSIVDDWTAIFDDEKMHKTHVLHDKIRTNLRCEGESFIFSVWSDASSA